MGIYDLHRFAFKALFCASICIFIYSGTVALAGPSDGEPIKPLLERLLAEARDLSAADRALFANVIDLYIPECPGKLFAFENIEQALRVKRSGQGRLEVYTSVVCDETYADNPEMRVCGEHLVLNEDHSLRKRADCLKPVGELARKLKEAIARIEEEKRNPPPEPTEEELRQKQTAWLMALLENDKTINDEKRRIYAEAINKHVPLCPDIFKDAYKTVRDTVWLRPFNDGFIAVSLLVCDWNDLDAFVLDKEAVLKASFTLPAGKYGLDPLHEFKVGDFTGDGQDELYYIKLFPTSSVPSFFTSLYIYKQRQGESTPVAVLELEVEEQDCWEPGVGGGGIGTRKAVYPTFMPEKGLIKLLEEESRIDCSAFSWGKEPVLTVETLSMSKRMLRWDPDEFSFVPAE